MKTSLCKLATVFGTFALLAAIQLPARGQVPTPPPTNPLPQPSQPCANQLQTWYGCATGNGGPNAFSCYSGDAHREVLDLSVFGSVGKMPLQFIRYSNTRMAPMSANQGRFGRESVWTHSYQWFLRDGAVNSSGQRTLQLGFPDGADITYTQTTSDPTVWLPAANISSRIDQNGNLFLLTQTTGEVYTFLRGTNNAGNYFYRVATCDDGEGNLYQFTYNNATDTLVRKVTDPSGRWLSFTYSNLSLFSQQQVTLGTVPAGTAVGVTQDIYPTNTTPCRFLTLYYSNGATNAPPLPVGDLKFFDQHGTLITGTPFGSAPYYTPTSTPDQAFDSDPTTYYRYAFSRNGYVGLDAGTPQQVSHIQYTIASAPGGTPTAAAQFIGMNDTSVANWVVKQVTASDGRSVVYDYTIFADPSGWFQWANLDTVTYPDGQQATYAYTQTAPYSRPILYYANDPRLLGEATQILYQFGAGNSLGFINSEIDAVTGSVLASTGADGDHKPKVIYPNGRVVSYQFYLANGNMESQTNPLGNKQTFTYDTANAGQLATLTDEDGHVTNYTHTALGGLASVLHPDGGSEVWTRDARDRVLTYTVSGTGLLPRTTTFTRDGATGRVLRIDYPDASFETFTYNALGEVLDHTLRNGGVAHNVYDASGRCTSYQDAAGNLTTFTYNANDLPATATLVALSQQTSLTYNDRGQVTKVTHPDGTFASYEYDLYGNQTARVDEQGQRWTATYDEFKRKTSSSEPPRVAGAAALTTTYGYDEPGGGCCGDSESVASQNLITIVRPSGKTTQFGYDLAWQRVAITEGLGTADQATTQYHYTPGGDIDQITDPTSRQWSYAYDPVHRRIQVTDPLTHATTWTYDAAGNRLTETRPDAGVTNNTYDSMNRLLTSQDPLHQTTAYAYDAGGNLATLTDARGSITQFSYDALNRRTRKTYQDGTHEDWTYDAASNLTTIIRPAGQTLTVGYDSRNRPTSRQWSDLTPAVSLAYDAVGRVTGLASSVSTLTYSYDNAGYLLSETQDLQQPVDLPPATVAYSYDADGNRAALTYPSGMAVAYAYTARQQVSSVTANGPPPLATFAYDGAGRRSGRAFENGTATAYSYDLAGQLTSVNHTLAGGATLERLDYTLNNVSDRTARTETNAGTAKTDAYAYDAIDQLQQAKYNYQAATGTQDREVDYAYDAASNRFSVSEAGLATPYTANTLNQYTAIDSWTAPGYDPNGNLTQVAYGFGQAAWSYSFDAENRLLSGSNGTTSFQFAYDARSRCVARTINGVTTLFLWDGWNLLSERDAANNELASYVHGPGADEMICRITAGGEIYYHEDGLGSTAALTDATGIPVEHITYDVYGTPSFFDATGQPAASSPSGNRFLFTGREWLAALSLNDHRNRLYSPDLGRWLSRDPIGEEGGINLYAYVRNNPLLCVDLLGLKDTTMLGDNDIDALMKPIMAKISSSGLAEMGPSAFLDYMVGSMDTPLMAPGHDPNQFFQYQGSKYPSLCQKTFSARDLNYLGVGAGFAAHTFPRIEMNAAIRLWKAHYDTENMNGMLDLGNFHLVSPSPEALAAAEAGWHAYADTNTH